MKETMEQATSLQDTTQSSGALIDQLYRYLLWRVWNEDLPRVLYILLNPSTATAHTDDPTLGRCIAFAKGFGYGSLDLVNLYAFRSSDPRALRTVHDPIGPLNDEIIVQAVQRSTLIICGWGACSWVDSRVSTVLSLLEDKPLCCFGKNKAGMPKHPLYLPATTSLIPYP